MPKYPLFGFFNWPFLFFFYWPSKVLFLVIFIENPGVDNDEGPEDMWTDDVFDKELHRQ